jgi:hypothetical protein
MVNRTFIPGPSDLEPVYFQGLPLDYQNIFELSSGKEPNTLIQVWVSYKARRVVIVKRKKGSKRIELIYSEE